MTPFIKVVPKPITGTGFSRSPTFGGVLSGISEIGFGACFFITWVNPQFFDVDWVRFALEVMLLEFILIHSAPFMTLSAARAESTRERVTGFAVLGGLYSLFVLGFCLALKSWRPMLTFWIVTAQRLAADIQDPKPSTEAKAWMMTSIGMNAVAYLLLVPLTLFLPLPHLGVTDAVRDALGIGGEGAWQDEPHRVVVLAGAYYVLRGLMTATAWPRRTSPQAADVKVSASD